MSRSSLPAMWTRENDTRKNTFIGTAPRRILASRSKKKKLYIRPARAVSLSSSAAFPSNVRARMKTFRSVRQTFLIIRPEQMCPCLDNTSVHAVVYCCTVPFGITATFHPFHSTPRPQPSNTPRHPFYPETRVYTCMVHHIYMCVVYACSVRHRRVKKL